MKSVYVSLIVLMAGFVFSEEECNKPAELKTKEEYCFTEEVEVVDRIVQQSKSVLNFAKKKLGITPTEDTNEQKCEYYKCILRQLHMLNANDYPAYDSITEWTKRNVVYFQALGLMEQLDKCHKALTSSTVREVNFYADHIDGEGVQRDQPSQKNQSSCDIAAEYVDCLSRQKNCPVFHFP